MNPSRNTAQENDRRHDGDPISPATGTSTGSTTGSNKQPASTGGMFSSLRNYNYRLYAAGAVVSNTGTWMQRIAQDWLVLKLTGSATAVGITTGFQFLPMLMFGLWGGVLADRASKRKLLVCTQAFMGSLAAVLAVLDFTGVVQAWHVWALAFLLGMATVVDNPTRQSFVVEMVGRADLPNAVSLNSANFQLARILGPAVGGVLITAVGTGWVFAGNAVSFAAVIVGLLAMRVSELRPVPAVPREPGQLREGLRYVRSRPDLVTAIALVGVVGTFGYNFPVTLAAFSKSVFHAGASSFGLLNTIFAVGSLAGALLAARRARTRMRVLLLAAVAFGVLESLAALMPGYWTFAVALAALGVAGLTFNTAANSTAQLGADPAMRGRVMGLYMLVFTGGTPIGGPLSGWVAETWGPRAAMLAGGLISLVATLLIGIAAARRLGVRLQVRPTLSVIASGRT